MKSNKLSHINDLRRFERRDFQDEITYNSSRAMYPTETNVSDARKALKINGFRASSSLG